MDEKLFKLQTPLNNWVYAKRLNKKWISDERLYVERQAFVESIMIFADISMYGKASIHFIEPNTGAEKVYPPVAEVVSQLYSSTGWYEVPHIYTVLHLLTCPGTPRTRILATLQTSTI